MTSTDPRAEALAALTSAEQANAEANAELPTATGVEVGTGNTSRMVIAARFPFIDGDGLYQQASRGDIVHVKRDQAERGEHLGALIDPHNPPTPEPANTGRHASDEDLAAMRAPTLVAWVNANPEERDRVRGLEENRREKDQRVTVLNTLDQLDNAYEGIEATRGPADPDNPDEGYAEWTDSDLVAEAHRRNANRDAEHAIPVEHRQQLVDDLVRDDEAQEADE